MRTLKELITILEERVTLHEAKLAAVPADRPFDRGHYSGWIAATNLDLEYLRKMNDQLDSLIPPIEEPYTSLRERLIAEEMA